MTDTNDVIAFAEFAAHWPGQSTYVCQHHADNMQRIATAMGLPTITMIPLAEDDVQMCKNCQNEARR